jgi:hypothetical protein
MALLDDLLIAHGGVDRWRRVNRFTLHLSIGGAVIAEKWGVPILKDLAVQGSIEEQSLEMIGLTASGELARYQPKGVALEDRRGDVLREKGLLAGEGRTWLRADRWDELQLAYFCGCVIWNHIVLPFCLADEGVRTEELPSVRVQMETWRRLKASFPERFVTYSASQSFYANGGNLLRRVDHTSLHDESRIAQEFWGHQRFAGIMVPTLSRQLILESDGAVMAQPVLVDVEIFDALYET